MELELLYCPNGYFEKKFNNGFDTGELLKWLLESGADMRGHINGFKDYKLSDDMQFILVPACYGYPDKARAERVLKL
jgi:hypothetical protein